MSSHFPEQSFGKSLSAMGLLPILFLFSYCFLGSAVPVPAIDVDCDDESIFEGVDKALKSYNEAKVGGNQFILYRITEAKIKQENDSLTHQFVNFEIRESVCPVKADTPWKQCDYKAEDANRGECSAHILVNTAENTKKVLSENCSIIPKVVEPPVSVVIVQCLGCYQPIDPNNEELLTLMQSTIENVNKIANHLFFFELENVTKAERKVVSGWIYNVEFNIIQTNCSKELYTNLNTEECTADLSEERGHCMSKVNLSPRGEIMDITSQCYLSTGFCLHCPAVMDSNDPEIQHLSKKFIEEYNLKNRTKLYNVVNITAATRQRVTEKMQYKLQITIQVSNCSKSDHAILGAECAIEENTNSTICDVDIDVVNETVTILPGYRCYSNTQSRIATVKGFSPLRLAIPKRGIRASEKSRANMHGQHHQREEKHGKMDKKEIMEHGKKKDHEQDKDHKKKKERSSEESEEDHRHKLEAPSKSGFVFPRVPVKDKVTQRPIVTEKITRQPAILPPTPFIPKVPSSTHSTAVPHNQGTLTPDLSSSTLATTDLGYKETYPTIDETVLDFPILPPSNIPKCPGKVWKPLAVIPKLAIEVPFIIGGLPPAADDLAPPEDPNPPTDLNTNTFFSIDDLLLDFDL